MPIFIFIALMICAAVVLGLHQGYTQQLCSPDVEGCVSVFHSNEAEALMDAAFMFLGMGIFLAWLQDRLEISPQK